MSKKRGRPAKVKPATKPALKTVKPVKSAAPKPATMGASDPAARPTCTFSSDEIKGLSKFFNYVQDKATFTMTGIEAQEYFAMVNAMVKHIRKCESFVFEIVDTSRAKK